MSTVVKCGLCNDLKDAKDTTALCLHAKAVNGEHKWMSVEVQEAAKTSTPTKSTPASADKKRTFSCNKCGNANMKASARGDCANSACGDHAVNKSVKREASEALSTPAKKQKVAEPPPKESKAHRLRRLSKTITNLEKMLDDITKTGEKKVREINQQMEEEKKPYQTLLDVAKSVLEDADAEEEEEEREEEKEEKQEDAVATVAPVSPTTASEM